MPVDETRFKRLAETPGVPGREERVRALMLEELAPLVDELRVDALGNVIGTRHGRDDVRVMIAAHMDEIGFLVRYIDERGALQLGRVMGPPRPGEAPTLPRQDEFFVDLGLPAAAVREAVRVGDFVTMDRA